MDWFSRLAPEDRFRLPRRNGNHGGKSAGKWDFVSNYDIIPSCGGSVSAGEKAVICDKER